MNDKPNMRIGYRAYEQHLQINHTPAEYITRLDNYHRYRGEREIREAATPRYLVSRCPFCGAARTALLDTHTLYRWSQGALGWGRVVGDEDYERERELVCEHFVAIQRFINLEGTVPAEAYKFTALLHLPFVMPFYLPDNMASIAVIHSLPVCRIEAADNGDVYHLHFNRFVKPRADIQFVSKFEQRVPIRYIPLANSQPKAQERLATARFKRRYTGFFVAHYAEDPNTLRSYYIDGQIDEDTIRDPDFTAADLSTVASMTAIREKYPEGYDLTNWVAKGKLQWLDLDNPELPLKAGPIEAFPYTELYDMTGERKIFFYRRGEFLVSRF